MKSEFLGYLPYCFASGVEYRNDRVRSYLTADQFWAMLVEQMCVMHIVLHRILLNSADFVLLSNV